MHVPLAAVHAPQLPAGLAVFLSLIFFPSGFSKTDLNISDVTLTKANSGGGGGGGVTATSGCLAELLLQDEKQAPAVVGGGKKTQ